MSDATPEVMVVFFAAMEQQSREDLEAYLDRACRGDAALRSRVEDLLRAHRNAGHFLGGSSSEVATADAPPCILTCGTKIGPYKLLQQIGEGGMGVVYMAEQQSPVVRKVALKVVKPGMDTREVVARFEAERQALAMMDHPNIAKVFDGGATESGRPYFVMELVRGIPITDYCDSNDLTTHERLQLFISVCNAVQHAHQKGVIHRDIKPTNVLVTLHDGEPVVKVIDFGVAKAIHQRLTDKTLFTNFMQMIGTPLYMSPEQAQISGLDIDTRTDIYSLGVLLYELLVGTTPFDRDRLKAAACEEIRRIIREEEPLRPSHRLSTLGGTITHVCLHRKTEAKKLSKQVQGELDWIVMKALEKDRNRRYESAGEFSRDIQRHLTHEPVQAGPPSVLYRLRKFTRRNKGVAGSVTVVLLAVLMGLGGSLWGLWRAGIERDRAIAAQHTAQQEEAKAKKAASDAQSALEIVANVLGGRDSQYFDNPERTAMEVLESLAKRMDSDEIHNPYVEANLRYMLGRAFHDAERFIDAHGQLTKALELHRTVYGNDHRAVADTLLWLTINAKRDASLAPAGEKYARESVAIFERLSERGISDMVATAHSELSAVLLTQGKATEAVKASEKAAEIEREVAGVNTGWTLLHLANCYREVKNIEQQIACLEQAYDQFELNTNQHGSWLCQNALTDAYALQGNLDKAYECAVRAVRLADSQGIHRMGRKRECLATLARRHREMGDREGEVAYLQQVVSLTAHAQDLDTPGMCFHRVSLAQALDNSGRSSEASRVARETLNSMQRLRDSGRVVWSEYADRITMADLCRMAGGDRQAAEEALSMLADAQAFKNGMPDYLVTFENGVKARALDVMEQRDEAIKCARAQLLSGHVEWIDAYGESEDMLVTLFQSAGEPDDATLVLEEGVRKRAQTLGDSHFAVDLARLNLGHQLCKQSRYSEAEQILNQAAARLLGYKHLSSCRKRELVELLAEQSHRRGDDVQEATWRQKLEEIEDQVNRDNGR